MTMTMTMTMTSTVLAFVEGSAPEPGEWTDGRDYYVDGGGGGGRGLVGLMSGLAREQL
ncbi:MAG: hypothetical protein M1826_007539 [Phylliscum demangeonii]|nr:MAG: hypothetical protein M1826_007539 [Phylliscum demangeonii]